jgi:hypothetical protein
MSLADYLAYRRIETIAESNGQHLIAYIFRTWYAQRNRGAHGQCHCHSEAVKVWSFYYHRANSFCSRFSRLFIRESSHSGQKAGRCEEKSFSGLKAAPRAKQEQVRQILKILFAIRPIQLCLQNGHKGHGMLCECQIAFLHGQTMYDDIGSYNIPGQAISQTTLYENLQFAKLSKPLSSVPLQLRAA